VTFAAQVPEDGFDQLVALQHRWPIATLWSTDLNRIEIFADTGARRLAAEVYVGGQLRCRCGGGPVFWLRGSPILVSVAQPAGIGPLEITASTCGSPIANITANTGAESRVSPRELRFYSTSPFASSTGRGDRVSPLTVFGGRVDSNTFLSHAQRSDLLTSLEFLHAPPP
jgi:hypothetical protein